MTPNHKISFDWEELTCTLKCLDVLGSLGQLGHGLDEGDSGLLVSLEGSKYGSGHFVC